MIDGHAKNLLAHGERGLVIASHSAGGWAAMDVVHRIQELEPERKVALILLDSPAPPVSIGNYIYPGLFSVFATRMNTFLDEGLKKEQRVDGEGATKSVDLAMADNPHGWTALGWYSEESSRVIPKQLDVPVLLVKAQEFIPEINVETIPELMTDDFGWRRFYSDLTILECDSNHFSMLVEPSPAQWVSGMLEWIKKQFA